MTDMQDVSHTPPNDARNWVQRRYERGSAAVSDGGRDDAEPRMDEEPADVEEEAETMKDVDHTPREGDGVNHVYQRGTKRE